MPQSRGGLWVEEGDGGEEEEEEEEEERGGCKRGKGQPFRSYRAS